MATLHLDDGHPVIHRHRLINDADPPAYEFIDVVALDDLEADRT